MKKEKKLVKKIHNSNFRFLRAIFKPFTKITYNYSAVPSNLKKAPYLIICNHQTTLDPFFLSLSFKFPLYFITSEDLFKNKLLGRLLSSFVGAIPKSKSHSDPSAIVSALKTIRQGGAIAVFPEGNRTLSGKLWEIDISISKFVKMTKVPLVIYNIHGGYGADPRWGLKRRKGKMEGYVKRVISPEEYNQMSNIELLSVINENLNVVEAPSKVVFKSKNNARNIERVLYLCTKCGEISTIKSSGSNFCCSNCGLKLTYSPNLTFEPEYKCNDIASWCTLQREMLESKLMGVDEKTVVCFDKHVKLSVSQRCKSRKHLLSGQLSSTKSELKIENKQTLIFKFSEISALTLVGKRKFNFYCGEDIYQIEGDKRFNSLKYLEIFEIWRKLS